ncbi:non-canonical purine NTP pyrophosphatase [Granulicella sp. L46]|uniref:non-canonical purine NTP pyrophosphatase n=1 Tax=Granulicella sp. L46 TaxID=1641865 RepID=UPI00131D3D3D|nr:non-canonical purine NTP pyrophosphatase [Granulicella sp. L46]
MKLYFVTMNPFKEQEVTQYLQDAPVDLQVFKYPIQEILNLNLEVIARDKALKAYARLGRPCAVEHGGLSIEALQGLPGGLSKVVWDSVADKVCNFLDANESRAASAQTVIGYCDGKRVHLFKGETKGTISECSRGDYAFQWDPIFIPNGDTRTYAEMGFPEKARYSQAAKAWGEFAAYLRANQG